MRRISAHPLLHAVWSRQLSYTYFSHTLYIHRMRYSTEQLQTDQITELDSLGPSIEQWEWRSTVKPDHDGGKAPRVPE